MTEKELIEKYLGTPYHHRGRDLTGLDCWGLIINIYKNLGIEVLDLDSYEKEWPKQGANLFVENYYSKWKKQKEPKFLDVLLFTNSKNVIFHAGIYLSAGRFIHVCEVPGVVVTNLDIGKWGKMLEGFHRYDNS